MKWKEWAIKADVLRPEEITFMAKPANKSNACPGILFWKTAVTQAEPVKVKDEQQRLSIGLKMLAQKEVPLHKPSSQRSDWRAITISTNS